MRTQIWNEMFYAKKNIEYISIYIPFLKSIKKLIDFLTLIFSTTSVVSWFIDSENSIIFLGLSIFIVSFLQVVDIIQIKFVASDEHIDYLRGLKDKWIKYFDELEILWHDINFCNLDDAVICKKYQKLKPAQQKIENLDSDIKIWKIPSINRKADLLTINFMKRYE